MTPEQLQNQQLEIAQIDARKVDLSKTVTSEYEDIWFLDARLNALNKHRDGVFLKLKRYERAQRRKR